LKVQTTGPSISLRFFNAFAAYSTRTSQPIRISSLKAKALLAYLAMHAGEEIPRERLGKLLWPTALADGRQNVRQCLLELQHNLKPYCDDLFIVTRDTIAIRADAVSTDVRDFERYAKSGDVQNADILCTGEFLATCSPESEDYASWIASERARLSALCCSVFRTLARVYDHNHRGAAAIRVAEKLVKFDPLREEWQRLLIELYARYNGRATALKYGKQVIGLIERELEADAEPETLALLDAVRRGDFINRAMELPVNPSAPQSTIGSAPELHPLG